MWNVRISHLLRCQYNLFYLKMTNLSLTTVVTN